MAAIGGFGPAVYGLTRGIEQGELARQRAEAHESDQAIRRERLGQEEALAPIRRRAAELSQEEQALQLAITGMKKEDQETVSKELRETLRKRRVFGKGLAASVQSGDWNHLGRALTEMDSEVFQNPEARRNPDGSITLLAGTDDERKEETYRGRNKNPKTGTLDKVTEGIGKDMSPDDELAMESMRFLDPMGQFEAKMKQLYDLERIAATGEWRVRQAEETGKKRVEAAEARAAAAEGRASSAQDDRAERALDRFYSTERGRVQSGLTSEFNNALAASMIPGYGRQMGDNDLRSRFHSMVEDEMSDAQADGKRLPAGTAFSQARDRVKKEYAQAYKIAVTAAQQLPPTINAGNLDQVRNAARDHQSARALLQVYELTAGRYGERVARHMLNTAANDRARRGTIRRQ